MLAQHYLHFGVCNMSSSDLNFAVRWIKGESWVLKVCDAVV